jgi:hypothetical protein
MVTTRAIDADSTPSAVSRSAGVKGRSGQPGNSNARKHSGCELVVSAADCFEMIASLHVDLN